MHFGQAMISRALPLILITYACAPPGLDEQSSELRPDTTTVVSLTFDDTLADQFQVGEMLAARGLTATFYINSTRLRRSGFMTLEQAHALQAQGNEIAGHTLDHVNLPTLSPEEMRRQICDDRDALLADGFAVTSFAYPFGAENETVREIVASCNYNSARDVGGLVSPSGCATCPYANPIPPVNPYLIRTNASIRSETPLETMQLYVTQAEDNGGGWVPLVFHHVCDGCSSNGISPALLEEFLDWLAARATRGTEVATVHHVIGGDVLPPASEEPEPTENLLINPSLEDDSNNDQMPNCWRAGGSGTNTATFSRTTTAADGSFAMRIDMTSFTSGARRLVSMQDSGGCAPPVTPGHTYTMRAQYIANVQPIFSVYYRSTDGTWRWLSQSPRLPTSSSYVGATYTSPPMPEDATAISVGLAITGVGFIVMDDYSLVDDQGSEPPPPPSNLLQNPSLEVDNNADQMPDCWRPGGSGTNAATFTRTTNAAEGSFAMRIDMTSFTSGARRLVSVQDSGACAPAVQPDRTYTMRARYIANTQPIFSVYYRASDGTWRWLSQSNRLPTSTTYVGAEYTSPPMPTDATAISVGLAITAVGSITMDAYELVEN